MFSHRQYWSSLLISTNARDLIGDAETDQCVAPCFSPRASAANLTRLPGREAKIAMQGEKGLGLGLGRLELGGQGHFEVAAVPPRLLGHVPLPAILVEVALPDDLLVLRVANLRSQQCSSSSPALLFGHRVSWFGGSF